VVPIAVTRYTVNWHNYSLVILLLSSALIENVSLLDMLSGLQLCICKVSHNEYTVFLLKPILIN
jgi:hypothetical protein